MQLEDERANVERLRTEASSVEAANLEARAKLRQLEADIARLSAERTAYLRVARANDFSLARFPIGLALNDYKRAVDAAQTYLDAPRWEQQDRLFNKRLEGKGAAEQRRMIEEEQARRSRDLTANDEAKRWVFLDLGLRRGNLQARAAEAFTAALEGSSFARGKLTDRTGREMILEQGC